MSFDIFVYITLSMISFFSAYFLIPSEYMLVFCIEKNEWKIIEFVMELCGCFDITLDEVSVLVKCVE